MLMTYKDIKKIIILLTLVLVGTMSYGQNRYKVEYNLTLTNPYGPQNGVVPVTAVDYVISFRSGTNFYAYYDYVVFTGVSILCYFLAI